MTEGTCVTPGCNRVVHIKKRGLCKRCYGVAWRADTLGPMTPRHELTDRDFARARATCSVCGPDTEVRVYDSISGLQAQCKMGARVVRRRMMYGIEWEVVEALYERVGKCCEICLLPMTLIGVDGGPRADTACLDHDHTCCPGKLTCGKCIRGLICSSCNIRLGYWERGQGLPVPAAAVAYLARSL